MTYIPEILRQEVAERAEYRCEYCLIHQADSLYKHEIDHIIPEQHRGKTLSENLCLACLECNRNKGANFASFDPETNQVTLLFNPRKDEWEKHFRLDGAVIIPMTAEGRVTVFLLKLNDEMRLRSRRILVGVGRYPPK